MKIDIRQPYVKQDEETLTKIWKEVNAKYCIVVGSCYHLAECALYDTWQLAKDSKVKGVWKMFLRTAYNRIKSNGIDDDVRKRLKSGYELWTDMTDVFQEHVARQLEILRLAIKELVMNAAKGDYILKASVIYSTYMYEFSTATYDKFISGWEKRYNIPMREDFDRFTDVMKATQGASYNLCSDCRKIIYDHPKLIACENALVNEIQSKDFLNKVAFEGMKVNGNYDTVIKQFELEEGAKERKELGIDKLEEKYTVKKSRKIRH